MGIIGGLNVLGRPQDELEERVVSLQKAVAQIGQHPENRHKDHQQHPDQPRPDLHRLLADARHAVAHHHQPDETKRPSEDRVVVQGVNRDESKKNLLHRGRTRLKWGTVMLSLECRMSTLRIDNRPGVDSCACQGNFH